MKSENAVLDPYVPGSKFVNKVADFFVNSFPVIFGEDIGTARRVSGYATSFFDVSLSGKTFDVYVECKIQAPDGSTDDINEVVAYTPGTFRACWKGRSAIRKMLQEKIRQKYPAH